MVEGDGIHPRKVSGGSTHAHETDHASTQVDEGGLASPLVAPAQTLNNHRLRISNSTMEAWQPSSSSDAASQARQIVHSRHSPRQGPIVPSTDDGDHLSDGAAIVSVLALSDSAVNQIEMTIIHNRAELPSPAVAADADGNHLAKTPINGDNEGPVVRNHEQGASNTGIHHRDTPDAALYDVVANVPVNEDDDPRVAIIHSHDPGAADTRVDVSDVPDAALDGVVPNAPANGVNEAEVPVVTNWAPRKLLPGVMSYTFRITGSAGVLKVFAGCLFVWIIGPTKKLVLAEAIVVVVFNVLLMVFTCLQTKDDFKHFSECVHTQDSPDEEAGGVIGSSCSQARLHAHLSQAAALSHSVVILVRATCFLPPDSTTTKCEDKDHAAYGLAAVTALFAFIDLICIHWGAQVFRPLRNFFTSH